MSNIKSEALSQKRSKIKVFLKLTGKQFCAGVSFIIMVQTFTFTSYPVQVFSGEICEIL